MADRLFVGMRLDTDAAAELARRAEAFDDRLVRRIASENLHVTLLFIGDPAPATADDLVRALTPAMDAVRAGGAFSAPVRAEIDRWGAFPPRRTPRVLWAGLESPTMEVLARRVVAALEPQGVAAPRRRFTPHVTVAYPRRGAPAAALRAAGTETAFGPPVTATFAAVQLIRSTTGPGGSRYEDIAVWEAR